VSEENRYPTTKEIIYLLGLGAVVTASILMPGSLYVAKVVLDIKREDDRIKWQKDWDKFNLSALKRNLKRLREQKLVEINTVDSEEIIKLTKKGYTKYLKFKPHELTINKNKWDGRWRIVIYDIAKFKKHQQERFRYLIKSMGFLQLQKSVYLTAYPCEEQIEYLREYFGIGKEVIYIRADKIENESAYRKYFGI